MDFKGFKGENLEVKISRDVGVDHQHLEVWYQGEMLWYAHLGKDAISLNRGQFHVEHEDAGNVYIELGGR